MLKNYDSICCFRSREDSLNKRVCWEITTSCNLRCPFCHRYDFDNRFYNADKLYQTVQLLKSKNITNVIISGGEPLLHPKLFIIMETLKSNGFDLDLCTNGTIVNDKLLLTLKKYLSEISISIDGYSSARHDSMRCTNGCFDKTVSGIKQFLNAGFEVHTTTVIDASFANEIINITEYLHNMGVKSAAYLGLIPIDSGKNSLFDKDCQRVLLNQINTVREKYPDMSINTKQLLVDQSSCSCGAGNIIYGLGTDGLELFPCLLTRKRSNKIPNNSGPGLCPGSRYLTQSRDL